MKSNKELTDLAHGLGKELGVAVETDGLKNEDLAALVADLEDRLKAKRVAEEERSKAGAMPPKGATKAASSPTFKIAPGRAITCGRGVLTEGDEISARDLTGALNNPNASADELQKAQEKHLADLVAGGHVVRS